MRASKVPIHPGDASKKGATHMGVVIANTD
jgi:hypothetical protein